jgi:hypothetical protein
MVNSKRLEAAGDRRSEKADTGHIFIIHRVTARPGNVLDFVLAFSLKRIRESQSARDI